MGVFIACMLHAQGLLDIRAEGFLATILMVKYDEPHEMKDLPVIAGDEDVFDAFGRGDILMIEMVSWTAPVSRSASGDDRTERADGKKKNSSETDFIRPSISP